MTTMRSTDGRSFVPLAVDPARSRTLPGYLYSEPRILDEERRRIFYRSWQLAGHVSELKAPGDYVTVDIVGQKVFVIRERSGKLGAFFNVCPHRAHELLKGRGNVTSAIVCPYHAWAYEFDGSLRKARATTRMPEFDPRDYSLVPVRLEEMLGFLFVNLDAEAMPISELVPDMISDMRQTMPWIGDLEVNRDCDRPEEEFGNLRANWKVLAENCLECYHCGPAHQAFTDLVDIGSYYCRVYGNWIKSHGEVNKLENKAYNVPGDAPVKVNTYWHLWPNIEFGLFPGTRTLSAFSFWPKDAETTRMSGILLTMPGDPLPMERIDYVRNVLWPEDESICESVHQGLKSLGYRQGRFVIDPEAAGLSENAVHGFQRKYAEVMGLS
ncbi:MAG: aromatic ring-hydroxylating dioxygenase subunit alpha [Hyphomicrobiaceae bacterium]